MTLLFSSIGFFTDGPYSKVFFKVALNNLFWSICLVMNSSVLAILVLKYLWIAAARPLSMDPTWGFVLGSYQGFYIVSRTPAALGTCFVHCLSANVHRFQKIKKTSQNFRVTPWKRSPKQFNISEFHHKPLMSPSFSLEKKASWLTLHIFLTFLKNLIQYGLRYKIPRSKNPYK